MSKTGDMYLVVADGTEEFEVALHYAAHLAKAREAKIGILHVMDREDFQHWANVQNRMYWEQRAEAEKMLINAARQVNELTGAVPAFYLEEGGRLEVILDIINSDHNITKLILGGATQGSGPGPIVSYFAGKGISRLRVPLTVIPGNIGIPKIDDLI